MARLDNVNAYFKNIDVNESIGVDISESNDETLETFTIRAKRKKLRRLKDVAQHRSCDSEVEELSMEATQTICYNNIWRLYFRL